MQNSARHGHFAQIVDKSRSPESYDLSLRKPDVAAHGARDVGHGPRMVPGVLGRDVGEVGHDFADRVHLTIGYFVKGRRRLHSQYRTLHRFLLEHLPEAGTLGQLQKGADQVRVEVGPTPFPGYGNGRRCTPETVGHL